MQKFVNMKDRMVDDSIEGFVKCYKDQVSFTDCPRTLKYASAPIEGKVGVVSGGGWGHDPAFVGYIGKNMLDAVAVGNTFTPPSVESFVAAFRAADCGKGVACLYGNFPADIANAEIAINLVAQEGIEVKSVIANDDVATAEAETRRGAAGEVLLWKVGGAAACLGYGLEEVISVSRRAVDNTRTIGVGLASCIIPEVGRPNYLIEMGTMAIGVGHHGLWSKDICKLRTADETADIMLGEITKSMELKKSDDVCVMISGLGNTMLSELHILYSKVYDTLSDMGVTVRQALIGNYFTSLDMMGATLTVMKLDDELKRLIDYPAYPVALSHFNNGATT